MKKASFIILVGLCCIWGCADQVAPKCYTGTVIDEYTYCNILSKEVPYLIIVDNSADYDTILTPTLPNQYKIIGERIYFNIQDSRDTMTCLNIVVPPLLVDLHNVSKNSCGNDEK
ncbi:MAG: hypothetical protein L3J06_02730 [Cyclobacteriaceae bacterium]|nr:hypothetical protein [Cyclobacteriaceae bacterium]